MTDFDYEVYQKKRVASGARHRVCGSKSKKCSLPSDSLTPKQWKERCGKVVSYNFTKPMTWDKFNKLQIETQKEYLLYLIDRYSASAKDISRMLGISPSYFSRYCSANDMGVQFQSKRVPAEAKKAFNDFCAGDKNLYEDQESLESDTPREEETVVLGKNEKLNIDVGDTRPAAMSMTEFSFSFSGPFDPLALQNTLKFMLPSGTVANIEIRCSVIS